MKPLHNVLLVSLFTVFTFFSCETDSFDDSLDDLEQNLVALSDCDDCDDNADYLETKVIPIDFDWTNIPANYANSIWDIDHNFNLGAASITLPQNVTLKFKGGSLNNYTTITGNNTRVRGGFNGSLDGSGSVTGIIRLDQAYPEWFGALGDGVHNDADAIISAIDFLNRNPIGGEVILSKGKNYLVDKEILLHSNISIVGNNAHITVSTANYDVTPNSFFAVFTTVPLEERPMSAPFASFGEGVIQYSNIHIKNITFNINRDGNTMPLNIMRSSDFNAIRFVDTENSTVQNCKFFDKQTSDIWTLVAVLTFEKSNNCSAINNTFDKCTAIAISEGSANIIDGNTMNNSPGTQIEVFMGSHHQIINNTTNEQWYPVSTIGSSAKHSIISNNVINASSVTGITMGHTNEVPGTDYGADYSVVENNYITGGAVSENTGRIGILSQNAIGLSIRNNTISNLHINDTYDCNDAAILISGATTQEEQSWHENLIVDGNIIFNVTNGIQIRDMIHATISNNTISDVVLGIYGESNTANSPNADLVVDGNSITNSDIALLLTGPQNTVINNTITETDAFGYLYYGHYTFNDNVIIESLTPGHSLNPLSFTMRDNYFYNTVPLGTLEGGSVMTMRAPDMSVNNLIVEQNTIDFPESGQATTWVLRAFELQGFTGSQFFN